MEFIVFTHEHIACAVTKDVDAALHFVEKLREKGIDAYVNNLEVEDDGPF